MYEAFYRLGAPPFRLTPDPRYLYLSAPHREALGHLLFGIRDGSGFVAVTGEIGTGKTTLLRSLLRDLEPNTVVAYIFNPALSDLELLQSINSELGLPATSTSKKELTDELNRFLMVQKLGAGRVVIIVDEAQNLAPRTLEQLRLLSNLETETEKLLQIVLVGQPELRTMLGRPELEQLNQRITVRWHLAPLDRPATAEYVRHRLRVAGSAPAAALFSARALALLYRHSGGVPRLINIAAHRALLVGFTRERRAIGVRTMRQAIREIARDDAALRPGRALLRPLFGTAVAAVALAVAAALALRPPWHAPRSENAAPDVPASVGDVSPAPADDSSAGDGAPVGAHDAPARALAKPPADSASGTSPTRPSSAGEPASPSAVQPVTAATSIAPSGAMASLPPASATVSPPDPAAFWAALATGGHRGAAVTATTDLLAVWGTAALRPEEAARANLDLEAIAARRGLRYLPVSGTLERLRLLDLPAILELSVPQSRQRRFAVLTALGDGRVRLRCGGVETTLTTEEIADAWLGEAHLFWRDFESLSPYLAPGSIGDEVTRLQHMLARIGEYHGALSQSYDQATAEAIARFQRSRRLVADGIVGPLTKIALYGALAGYDHPRLDGDT